MLPESMGSGGIIAIVIAVVLLIIFSLGWIYRKLLDSNQKLQLRNKSSKQKRLDKRCRYMKNK